MEVRGGASVVARSAGQIPLAARTLTGGAGRVRVALVQTAASILAGDRVVVDVEVGPGASLELLTIGATVAYPAASEARQSFSFRVARGGRLAWLPQPLVLARGCDLVSTTELELAEEAAAVVRELVSLGRHGEPPGRCRSALRCDLGGAPLLRDAIAVDPGWAGSRVRMETARAYGSLALLGLRARKDRASCSVLALEGPGELFRALGADGATIERELGAIERTYLAELWARPRSAEARRESRGGARA